MTGFLFEKYSEPLAAPIATGPAEDIPRLSRHCDEVLERLRQGPATNAELNAICLRYGARIFDLRKAGYKITTKRQQGGVFVFELH